MSEVITIVSGLPRSGTSLMMRMLEAGGMEVVVDHIRTADVDNPAGYYEFERVKKLKEDQSWLPQTKGKVFKMVSMLLFDLPQTYFYRIVFMRRAMKEILASQARMLERLHDQRPVNDARIEDLFSRHLEKIAVWLSGRPGFEVLYVDYNNVIQNPSENAIKIAAFLQQPLDVRQMAAVVDPSLYRNRVKLD